MSILQVSDPYAVRTQERNKRPVYYVEFGIIGDGNPSLGHAAIPVQFSSGPIAEATQDRATVVDLPQTFSNTITPYSGKSSIGGMNLVLQDRNGIITSLVSNYTMKNRIVTLYAGYVGMPEVYFYPLYRGVLKDVALSTDGTRYNFEIADFLKEAKTNILTAKTAVFSACSSVQITIPVYGVSGFAAATDLGDGLGKRNYIRVDDEVIEYTSIVAYPTYWDFAGCTRGALGTKAVTHDVDAEVTNFIRYTGNPLDIALAILTSTGTGANGAWDIYPASQGAGVPVAYVNTDLFVSQRTRFIQSMEFEFYEWEEAEAKEWLEKNIFKAINAYPIVETDGRIGVKLYTVPLPTAGAPILDQNNIIGTPVFRGNYATGKAFFNELDIKYDYDPIVDRYAFEDLFEDSTSQVKFAEVSTLLYEQRGVKSYLRADLVNRRTVNNIFKRFSNPAPEFDVQAFFGAHLVNPGETVILKHPALPDLKLGRRGIISTLCEVTDRSVDHNRGLVNLKLLATEFAVDRRYGAISPANYPTYLAATDDQRKYAFLSDEIVLETVGHMSNGDDGYYITP